MTDYMEPKDIENPIAESDFRAQLKDSTREYTFLKPDGSRFSFTDKSYESASKRVNYKDQLISISK